MLFTLITLWFDVGIVRYTTCTSLVSYPITLWFDVGIVRYTTEKSGLPSSSMLWFDVGIVRYTTWYDSYAPSRGCGLM